MKTQSQLYSGLNIQNKGEIFQLMMVQTAVFPHLNSQGFILQWRWSEG